MRLGIGSYTYSWAMGIPGYDNGRPRITCVDIINRAAERRCDLVQLCDNAFLERMPSEERSMLGQQCRSLNLGIQVGTRGVDPANVSAFLGIAMETRSDLVRSMLPKEGYGTDLNDAIAMLKEVMPAFEKADILLSLENHDRHTCRELRTVLDRVGSRHLGICLDTANSYGVTEDVSRVIDTLLPVANCVHIKDFSIRRISTQMGFHLGGAPAGMGMVDIKKIMDGYAGMGEKGAVILELWTPYINDLEETIALENRWAELSLEYMRPFFKSAAVE